MAKNTGKNFENEIRKSLEKADIWWFRIQDTNDVSRFVKKAVAEKQPVKQKKNIFQRVTL